MRKILSIFFVALFWAPCVAQEAWSLERCMAYAAEHASEVGRAQWGLLSSQAEYANAVADFFPSVSASTAGQLSWGRNIDPETNTYNNVTTFNNGYGLYVSMTLFDGAQTYNRWRMARAQKERSANAVDMKRDDSAIAAMLAYVDAVYCQGAIAIAADKLEQSEAMMRLTEAQEQLGIKGLPDVAQARATLAEDQYNLVHQQNLSQQAMLTLRGSMNFPAGEALAIDTAAACLMPGMQADNPSEVFALALATNPNAIDAELNVKASHLQYSMAKGALWPTLSLSAGISTSYYKTLGSEYSFPKFSDQFRNNRGEYLQVSLSIPVFDNLYRTSKAKQARFALEIAREERDDQLRKLRDDISRAIMDRDGYAAEVRAMAAKVDADLLAYKLNMRKYEEGLLSLIDLQLSANAYFSSRLSLLQKQMLYLLKDKLVAYYKGEKIY